MIALIACLLVLILLAIAAPQLLLNLALLVAWPIDIALFVVLAPLRILGVCGRAFFDHALPRIQKAVLWLVVAILVADLGGHLLYWAYQGLKGRWG